jgi:hypothetical protein
MTIILDMCDDPDTSGSNANITACCSRGLISGNAPHAHCRSTSVTRTWPMVRQRRQRPGSHQHASVGRFVAEAADVPTLGAAGLDEGRHGGETQPWSPL